METKKVLTVIVNEILEHEHCILILRKRSDEEKTLIEHELNKKFEAIDILWLLIGCEDIQYFDDTSEIELELNWLARLNCDINNWGSKEIKEQEEKITKLFKALLRKVKENNK